MRPQKRSCRGVRALPRVARRWAVRPSSPSCSRTHFQVGHVPRERSRSVIIAWSDSQVSASKSYSQKKRRIVSGRRVDRGGRATETDTGRGE